MKDFRKHPGFDKVCLVCCYKSKKDKHNKVIKGSNWRRHIEYVHKGDIPPYAILKRCNVADEVDYECRLSKELWGKLGELATDVPPTIRNAPDDLSNIQLPHFAPSKTNLSKMTRQTLNQNFERSISPRNQRRIAR